MKHESFDRRYDFEKIIVENAGSLLKISLKSFSFLIRFVEDVK